MVIYCFECDRRVDTDYEDEHFDWDENNKMYCLIELERQALKDLAKEQDWASNTGGNNE